MSLCTASTVKGFGSLVDPWNPTVTFEATCITQGPELHRGLSFGTRSSCDSFLCPPKKGRRTGRQNTSQELPTYLLIIPPPNNVPPEKGDPEFITKAGAAFFVVVVVVVVVVTADAGT